MADISDGFWADVAANRVRPRQTRTHSAFWSRTWGRAPDEIFRIQPGVRTGPEEHRLLNVPEAVVVLDVPSFMGNVEKMFVRGEHLKVVKDVVRMCWDEADVLLSIRETMASGVCLENYQLSRSPDSALAQTNRH
jgi:hypothetical protein